MSYINEAGWDRVVRILLGLAMLYLGWSGLAGDGAGFFLKTVGFLPLITGLVGWCPLYAVLKFRTNKA